MPSNPRYNVALGLGANLDNRETQLRDAVERLQRRGFAAIRCSSFYNTEPVDCVPGTPRFLNAAVVGTWPGTPRQLLETCKEIETAMGRPREHSSSESRLIDIDILLFEQQVICEQDLQVPHPKLTGRLFILKPLNEIASDWVIPEAGLTVAQAFQRLSN